MSNLKQWSKEIQWKWNFSNQGCDKNQILETLDTARGMIEILYNNEVSEVDKPVDVFLDGIEQVTKEDIIAAAEK